MSKITLQCVEEKNELRIKFHSFTDDEGKVYLNVYDNSYKIRKLPITKDIRVEGRFYEIGANDSSLVVDRGAGVPFYNVKFKNIKTVAEIDVATKPVEESKEDAAPVEEEAFDGVNLKIVEVMKCIACLSAAPAEILIPCGHKCLCKNCSRELRRTLVGPSRILTKQPMCPLCKRDITCSLTVNI